MELKPVTSTPAVASISLKRISPALHCERRSFDYVPSRFLIPASSEGYLTLFSNDSSTILPLDVATDDWCAIETSGFERLADDAPLDSVCVYAKLYVIGQSSPDDKAKKKPLVSGGGGCEIKIQYFDFATRKWGRVGTFAVPSNAELIAAAVFKKYEHSKLSIFVLCANAQLIEATVDPELAIFTSVHRSTTHNAPPLLNSSGATIAECADLQSPSEWKWLERRAFVDPIENRLLWLGVSNCAYDTLHTLDLSSPAGRAGRQWTSVRIPRNDRRELTEIGHRHPSRVAYLPAYQRFLFLLSEISEEAVLADALVPESTNPEVLSKTVVWTVSLSTLARGWSAMGEIPDSDITCVSGGDFNDVYYLSTTMPDQQHRQQSVARLFLDMPSLKFLALTAVINALDPKTKRIQKKHLIEQLGKSVPNRVVDSLWYRTKLDRGVLRYLSKGMGFYGEYAKDDDEVPFWRKLTRRLVKR